jgi:hypothetical protein
MKIRFAAAVFALGITFATSLAAVSAATPAPKAAPHAVPTPYLPPYSMHTDFLVEVNNKGQVVRVKSGHSAKTCPKNQQAACLNFNAHTYGNVLQMWIRHPDGSAEVGLYKITYDYDPKTHNVHRAVAIVSRGGNWGDKQGAATDMMNKADAEARATAAKQKQQNNSLPDLNKIVAPSPTHKP